MKRTVTVACLCLASLCRADVGVVKGTFKVTIKAHHIDVPSELGITVKPEVKVAAALVVKP
jgi:hypothetical protein